jgi:SAM-dependent methyltransferase
MMRQFGISNPKHAREMGYWVECHNEDNGRFDNGWYRNLMLAIAGESDATFLAHKVVADFGCGPRGSLCWAADASRRIGIDVLADKYRETFALDNQAMEYVTCTETEIPLPDGSIDVLFTMNALDHTERFDRMCAELLRILAPGGLFVGSLNLNESATVSEPQSLSNELVELHLLRHLTIETRREARQGPPHDTYLHCRTGAPLEERNAPHYLWVRARKPL